MDFLNNSNSIIISKICSAKIFEITSFGELSIKFNFSMKTDFNYTWLNSSNIEMYIIPANDRHL